MSCLETMAWVRFVTLFACVLDSSMHTDAVAAAHATTISEPPVRTATANCAVVLCASVGTDKVCVAYAAGIFAASVRADACPIAQHTSIAISTMWTLFGGCSALFATGFGFFVQPLGNPWPTDVLVDTWDVKGVKRGLAVAGIGKPVGLVKHFPQHLSENVPIDIHRTAAHVSSIVFIECVCRHPMSIVCYIQREEPFDQLGGHWNALLGQIDPIYVDIPFIFCLVLVSLFVICI